ncbi:unnamed protein product [Chilo suppressalis]|uniref:Uncharacterized protein n=1 Tax=Chilo suppressalis TaxID=168631 RepID=A0ABN8AX12_CHISP|nr:unnamed protein product [Chilo suppressalis]
MGAGKLRGCGELKALRQAFSERSKRQEKSTEERTATATPEFTPTDDSMELLKQFILNTVGTMLNTRLESLEARLPPAERLRPPLASDVRREAPSTSTAIRNTTQQVSTEESRLAPIERSPEAWTTVAKKKKNCPQLLPSSQKVKVIPAPPTTSVLESSKSQTKQPAKKMEQKRKLTAPRTTAVVVTITPEAEKEGLTYAQAIRKAKNVVQLEDLDIEGVQFRHKATRARIIQVPGATSGLLPT